LVWGSSNPSSNDWKIQSVWKMILKFSCATLLALASTSTSVDAFLTPAVTTTRHVNLQQVQMVGSWDNDDFLDGLSGGQDDSELSVEEQARRFREMMQNGGSGAGADVPPPPRRVAQTDRAGRPVGRNRDADTIANTADLYFAQLKRDSTVRGMARLRGDQEEADKVFEDEGIKELEKMVTENPYLKGQREKEKNFFDTVPEELIKPFFDPDKLPEDEKTKSGVSYKEMLEKRRQKKGGVQQTQAAPAPPTMQPTPQVAQEGQTPPQQQSAPEPVVASQPPPQPQQPVSQPAYAQQTPAQPQMASPQQVSTPSNPEDTKRMMRTTMGMLLKHRGGPGFGKGRLKGGEIDKFENLAQDVVGTLRAESSQSSVAGPQTTAQPPMPQQSMAPPAPAASAYSAPAAPAAQADPSQLGSMIACIEGAITMYKNSPVELKSSVMALLRDALASAVTTCDGVIGSPDMNPAPTMSQVEGTIAVIEGAISMYKNSPAELQSSVLFTLRAALRSAVSTCNSMLGTPPPVQPQQAYQQPVQPPPQVQQPIVQTPPPQAQQVAPQVQQQAPPAAVQTMPQEVSPQPAPAVVPATDRNSKALDDIYNRLQGAHGDGTLGLRPDLTSEDASELADKLAEMRGILMEELDAGIPDPNDTAPAPATQQAKASAPSDGTSTVSKYQQMLAKAKAEKAAKA